MPVTIGVLHSTAFTSPMQDNFIEGLQGAGHWPDGSFDILPPKNEEGNYGHGSSGQTLLDLINAAKAFADSGCSLIVAGGLVALDAADKVNRTPTVGLIGRMPQNNAEPGWHATQPGSVVKAIVNLDTPSHNGERGVRLNQPPFNTPQGGIALMVNTNSAMGELEYDQWVGGGGTGLKFPDLAGKKNNDAVHFVQFFKNVSDPISGIIVSSDPFLFRVRTRLIVSADAARPAAGAKPQFKFCFPFAEWHFKDSGVPLKVWDSNRHIGYCGTGMDLLPAYKQLGVAADGVLSTIYPPPVVYTASKSRWEKS